MKLLLASLLLIGLAGPAIAQTKAPSKAKNLFEEDSSNLRDGRMKIRISEIERRRRSSVVLIDMLAVGQPEETSQFILCSLRRLDRARGGSGHIASLEDPSKPDQLLIGFLKSPEEPPGNTDPQFAVTGARAKLSDLNRVAQVCAKNPKGSNR